MRQNGSLMEMRQAQGAHRQAKIACEDVRSMGVGMAHAGNTNGRCAVAVVVAREAVGTAPSWKGFMSMVPP